LLGDVVAGDYVLANSSGYSDPFALSVLNTNPTDPTTTLNITSSASELVEGDQIAFELLHSGSAQQTYYWSISGDVDLDDFSGLTSLNGQVDLTEGIPSELVFVTKSNDISEPIESLSFNVFSDSLYQDKIRSSNVSVLDDGLSEPTGTSFPTDGDDVIIGTESDDVLTGVISSDPTPGRGEVDVVTGLSGVDIFVLGDERGVFYDDGSSRSSGSSDYMLIKDFEAGTDKLQLLNDLYWITPGDTGLNLFWNSDGNNTFDAKGRSKDELIAILEGVDTISNNDLILV